jgi:putative CocE/NonD family hydrolase
MHFYRSHLEHGAPQACERHYLVIGPWDHAGTRTPAKEFGGLKFGDASLVDLNQLHKQWYDWTMKDGKKPEFLKQRVAYYVMGAEEWKYAESLEAIPTTARSLYLGSDGRANDVFHSGALSQAQPGASAPDQYTYDPLDVHPADMEREEVKDYIVDQRYALNLFGSGLIYHSEPFEAATEITGYIRLVVWISLDVPDTDFAVDVYEIMPSGMSVLLTQDALRARYRESLHEAKPVTPGQVNRYEFGAFPYFSRRIAQGSRLRLVIRALNSIYWQKNYNSGGDVSAESAPDARTAHVTLYHDVEHPSALELPVSG